GSARRPTTAANGSPHPPDRDTPPSAARPPRAATGTGSTGTHLRRSHVAPSRRSSGTTSRTRSPPAPTRTRRRTAPAQPSPPRHRRRGRRTTGSSRGGADAARSHSWRHPPDGRERHALRSLRSLGVTGVVGRHDLAFADTVHERPATLGLEVVVMGAEL